MGSSATLVTPCRRTKSGLRCSTLRFWDHHWSKPGKGQAHPPVPKCFPIAAIAPEDDLVKEDAGVGGAIGCHAVEEN